MAKTRYIQSNFVSGELSPLLKGRTDINQYYQAVEKAENVVIVPQGGLRRRPGTAFVGSVVENLSFLSQVPTMPNGGTGSVINDLDDTTTTSTTTGISTTDPYVVCLYDLGLATTVEFFDLRSISLSSGTSDDFKIQYSTDNVTFVDAADVPLLGTNAQDFRVQVTNTARYWRLARIGTDDLGAATVTAAGVNPVQENGLLAIPKLVDFSVEDDRHYLIEFTLENIRIYRSTGGATPSTTRVADLKPLYGPNVANTDQIRVAQIENVMLIFGTFQPMRLVNLGTDDEWVLDYIPFTNIPQFDYDDNDSPTPTSEVQVMTLGGGSLAIGDRFQVDIESIQSKNITFAGDSTADERSSTVFNIQKNLQEMPVFASTGVSVARTGALQYTITISGASAKAFELFAGYFTEGDASNTVSFTQFTQGLPRKEDVWSSTRGWPRSACFYEGRLVIGGTQSKPQSLFMSKSNDFFNFDLDDGDDDEAIFATLSSRNLTDIVDVYPGRNLQVFTSGAEFAVTSRPVTPSNINVQPQTSHGANTVEVQDVDGSTLFIDRHGKSLLGFVYSFNEDAYVTDDRSVLASHLINKPVDMALLAGTSSDDANWLFIVNDDGNATILNTLRSQDINGYTQWTTPKGDIKSVCVVDDQLFMSVERDVDSSDRLFIERWDFDHMLDCSIKNTRTGSDVTGLEHLNGEDVSVLVDTENYVLDRRSVDSNKIVLDSNEEYSGDYEVGILFTPTIKPMPLNTNLGSGANQMRLKKIVRMNLRVYESSGITIDGIAVPIRAFGSFGDTSPLSPEPITPTSGIIEDVYDINGWGREVVPTISTPDPTPMHIQMIEYEVEGN
tara:strand:- start:1208 stop:3724 length:2517 start_codon:yes stop_codon:yes gene_type:complete